MARSRLKNGILKGKTKANEIQMPCTAYTLQQNTVSESGTVPFKSFRSKLLQNCHKNWPNCHFDEMLLVFPNTPVLRRDAVWRLYLPRGSLPIFVDEPAGSWKTQAYWTNRPSKLVNSQGPRLLTMRQPLTRLLNKLTALNDSAKFPTEAVEERRPQSKAEKKTKLFQS